jgi:protein TonB
MRLPLLVVAALTMGPVVAIGQDRNATDIYSPGDGVSLPNVVTRVKPTYTAEARAAQIQGTVMVEAIVLADGTVGDVKVVEQHLGRVGVPRRSIDTAFGLDQQAMNAARQWVFRPGTKGGRPVAVRVRIELPFDPSTK